MLKVNQLKFFYEKNKVLNDLSFDVSQGEVFGILGLNGAGKSTLMNLLAGFLPLQYGEVMYFDKAITGQEVSILETQNFFYAHLTAEEYLSIFLNEKNSFDITMWANLLEIPLDTEIDEFSTGMKKKLALLSILLLDRPIVLLDEPFNGLDLEASFILKEIILRLKSKGKTILLTSHILETLTGVCDRILWLKNGRAQRTFVVEEFGEVEKILKEDWSKLEVLNQLL